MKFVKLICLMLVLCALVGCGKKPPQPVTVTGQKFPTWVDTKAGGIKLQIPPTLEVQDDKCRTRLIEQKPFLAFVLPLGKECFVLQAKGLNAGAKDLKQAGAVFQTLSSKDKVPKFGYSLGLKEPQVKEFGEITKTNLIASWRKINPNVRFVTWEAMHTEIVNGVECLKIACTVEVDKSGPYAVERYIFFNTDRVHNFTVGYLLSEKDYWTAQDKDIRNIVDTLSIAGK